MYLQKRTYSYYFRMPIPSKLRQSYGKAEICFSLNTLNRTEAKLKSLEHIQHYLLEFEQRKASPLISSVTAKHEVAPIASVLFSDVYQKYLKERKPAEGILIPVETAPPLRQNSLGGDRWKMSKMRRGGRQSARGL